MIYSYDNSEAGKFFYHGDCMDTFYDIISHNSWKLTRIKYEIITKSSCHLNENLMLQLIVFVT